MKICNACNLEKPLNDFYIRNVAGRQYPYTKCKTCSCKAAHNNRKASGYYERNKDKESERNRRRYAEIKESKTGLPKDNHGNMKVFTIADLREFVKASKHFNELYQNIGYKSQPNKSVRNYIKRMISEFSIDHSHFITKNPTPRYTKERLEPYVLVSTSHTEVLRKLGINIAGSNMANIKRAIERFEISTEHFTVFEPALDKKYKEITVIQHKEQTIERAAKLLSGELQEDINSHWLIILMEQDGKTYECSSCFIDEWMSKNIRLEVDHIDGNRKNNHRNNLRFLCPNCHSQTETFGRKKMIYPEPG
jgi:hypothetical protein